eukprot:scaffold101793_cov61-Attheya_sp.AAC.3
MALTNEAPNDWTLVTPNSRTPTTTNDTKEEEEDPFTQCPPGTIFLNFWCTAGSFKNHAATTTSAFEGNDAAQILHKHKCGSTANTRPLTPSQSDLPSQANPPSTATTQGIASPAP